MWIFLNIGAGIIIFVMLPAIVFYNAESGWTYVDSVYFAFVSLSTIGFGDLINGGGEVEKRLGNWMWAYRVFTILWLVSGLSFIFMVNTLILDRIRKKTNHTELKSVIICMNRLKKGILRRGRGNRKRVRPDQERLMEDRERNEEDRERNEGDRKISIEVAEQYREDTEKQWKEIVGEEVRIEREGARIQREGVRIEREGVKLRKRGGKVRERGSEV